MSVTTEQAAPQQAQAFSLAELAQLNTDDVATLTSRLPPEGIFIVDGAKAGIVGSESNDPAKPPLFRIAFEYAVLDAKLVDQNLDPNQFIGKNLRESYTLWPNDLETAIGLMKGRYKLSKLPNTGVLGGVEGQPPGWLDSMVGARFMVRIRHWTRRDGTQVAQFDWMEYKPDEAAAA
jgi:hypothetical protein